MTDRLNCQKCATEGLCLYASSASNNELVVHTLCQGRYGNGHWCCPTETNGRQSVCSRYDGQCDYYGSLSMLLLGWVIPAMIIGLVFSMCFYCRRRRVIQQMKVHNEHHAVHQQHVEANGGIPFAVPAEEYGQYNAVDPPVAQPAPETSGRGPPAVSGFAMAAGPVTVRPETVSGPSMGATGRAGFS